jgi:hypothetical protein
MDETKAGFVEMDVGPFQIRDIESLVVLLVGGFEDDLLFGLVHFHEVGFGGVGEVSDSPLERFEGVLPHEDGLHTGKSTVLLDFIRMGASALFSIPSPI